AEAAYKHLSRVYRIASDIAEAPQAGAGDDDLLRAMHKAIHDVTMGVESFGFNAAIAKLYGFTNTMAKTKAGRDTRAQAMRVMAQLMAPVTPHLSEEIWSMLGGEGLIANAPWPVADESYLVEDTVTLPIQVNGKRRSELTVAKDLDKDAIEKLVLDDQAVQKALAGGAPKKLIVVPGRIVNVVV
ncbi:MAG: class I tRNA ligase family protein, partial [Pseudomonadota bacterium]